MNRSTFAHSKSGHIRISDPHCTSLLYFYYFLNFFQTYFLTQQSERWRICAWRTSCPDSGLSSSTIPSRASTPSQTSTPSSWTSSRPYRTVTNCSLPSSCYLSPTSTFGNTGTVGIRIPHVGILESSEKWTFTSLVIQMPNNCSVFKWQMNSWHNYLVYHKDIHPNKSTLNHIGYLQCTNLIYV